MSLRLDWCSWEAAKYAVEHWHYSRSMPAISRMVKIGVWEDGRFIGAVIVSLGATRFLGRQFGLSMEQCCELTRVALDSHRAPVSRILAVALRMVGQQSPGVRLVISYADCDQDHLGAIYQAGNWVYLGLTEQNGGTPKYRIHGRVFHARTMHSRRWRHNLEWVRANLDPNASKVWTKGKHKYAYPMDDAMRAQIAALAQPYPKRATSIASDAPADQAGEGGATPTVALS